MKNLLLFITLYSGILLNAAVTSEINSNQLLTLENKYIKAVFSPVGGRLVSFVDKKSNQDLTFDDVKNSAGALKDQFIPNNKKYTKVEYDISILKNQPDQCVIQLKSPFLTGDMQFLQITKIITLNDDSRKLDIKLIIHNKTESMSEYISGYHSHNFFGVRGEPNLFIAPDSNGTTSMIPDAKNNTRGLKEIRDLTRGFVAVIGQKSKLGVILLPEYKRFALCYSWYCKSALPLDTLEFQLIPEIIENGKSLESDFSVAICSELDYIDGASNAGYGKINYTSPDGSVELKSFEAIKGTLEIYENDKLLLAENANLEPDKMIKVNFVLKNPDLSNLKITAKFFDREKKLLLDLNKVVRGENLITPLEKRNPAAQDDEEWQFKISETVKTPHSIWLEKPKTLNYLFLLTPNGARDIIELKQRSNFFMTVPTIFPADWYMSWRENTTQAASERKDGTEYLDKFFNHSKYDAIIIGSDPLRKAPIQWENFPPAIQNQILSQVNNGSGLLYINPEVKSKKFSDILKSLKDITQEVKSTMDFSAAPHFEKCEIFAGNYGKGRIVVLKYPVGAFLAPHPGYRKNNYQLLKQKHRFQEYQFAILTKLLNYATGNNFLLENLKFNAGKLEFDAKISGTGKLLIHDKYSQKIQEKTINITAGKNIFIADNLRKGKNYAHIILDGKDFGFAVYDFNSADYIEELTYAPENHEFNIKTSGKNPELNITITDNNGRLLHQTNKSNFIWQDENPISSRHIVKAQLLKNNTIIDEERVDFYMPEIFNGNEFMNMVWIAGDEFPEYSYPEQFEALRKFGFNFLYSASPSESIGNLLRFANVETGTNCNGGNVLFYDRTIANGIKKWTETHDKKYLVRPKCPNNPEWKQFLENYQPSSHFLEFGTRRFFQLGDEMSMTFHQSALDLCFCEYCLKDFRAQLQLKYKNLNALNQNWRSNFKHWDEVIPSTFAEILLSENPASYVEHRRFMDKLFVDSLNKLTFNIRKVYPDAVVGPTGVAEGPHVYGGNWNFGNMRNFGCVSMYGGSRIPVSLNRNRLVMLYRGYAYYCGQQNYSFFEGIFGGENSSNSWFSPMFLLPDLRESEVRQYYKNILWELRSGMGDLLKNSEKITNQAAILHSQSSLTANFIKQKKTDYYQKELSYAKILEDLGIAYRFILPEELSQLDEFQTLILPEASALSDTEINFIKNFKGTVIADYDLAVMNELCIKRQEPALNESFGIKTKRPKLQKISSHNIKGVTIEQAVKNVMLTTGKTQYYADENIPLAIKNGNRIYLNFSINYNAYREIGLRKLFANLIKTKPLAKVESEVAVMHSFYKNGDNLYIALLPEHSSYKWEKQKLSNLPKFNAELSTLNNGHLYNLRTKEYYGYGKKFNLKLTRGDGTLLALLPNKATPLSIKAPETAKRGETVSLKVKSNLSHHVFLMEVIKPNGEKSLEYRSIKNINGDKTEFKIPFALNDETGTYIINIYDYSCNMKNSHNINLK